MLSPNLIQNDAPTGKIPVPQSAGPAAPFEYTLPEPFLIAQTPVWYHLLVQYNLKFTGGGPVELLHYLKFGLFLFIQMAKVILSNPGGMHEGRSLCIVLPYFLLLVSFHLSSVTSTTTCYDALTTIGLSMDNDVNNILQSPLSQFQPVVCDEKFGLGVNICEINCRFYVHIVSGLQEVYCRRMCNTKAQARIIILLQNMTKTDICIAVSD